MKITNMVSTSLILTLLGSNIIMGEKYILDQNKLEKKIHTQSQLIVTKQKNNELLKRMIDVKSFENYELTKRYGNLNQQLDKIDKENTSLKKDNIKLKKELEKAKEVNKKRKLKMRLSFYGSDCYKCSGITKIGVDIRNTIYYKGMRIVASDPRVIPLHSIIEIKTKTETYRAYVGDTGGKIIGNVLDVLVSSEKESFKHGIQYATVTILKEGK